MGQLAKGHQTLAHKVALLEVEVARLTEANRRLNKQKRAKKKRLQLGGSLTTDQAVDILAQRDVDIQLLQEDREGGRQRGADVEGFVAVGYVASQATTVELAQ